MTTTIPATPSAVPRSSILSAFELSPEVLDQIRVKVGVDLWNEKLNALDKKRKRGEAFNRANFHSDKMLLEGVIRFDDMDDAERAARIRAREHAEVAWLDANPGDDLDAERIAFLRRLADDDLKRAADLAAALVIVEGVEECWEDEAPSKTQRRIKERFHEELDGAGCFLSSAITATQAELVASLAWMNRSFRWERRWRFVRDRTQGNRVSRLDVALRVRLVSTFEACISTVETQRDVKALLDIWGEPAELVRDAEGTRFVGRGFTIFARN